MWALTQRKWFKYILATTLGLKLPTKGYKIKPIPVAFHQPVMQISKPKLQNSQHWVLVAYLYVKMDDCLGQYGNRVAATPVECWYCCQFDDIGTSTAYKVLVASLIIQCFLNHQHNDHYFQSDKHHAWNNLHSASSTHTGDFLYMYYSAKIYRVLTSYCEAQFVWTIPSTVLFLPLQLLQGWNQ